MCRASNLTSFAYVWQLFLYFICWDHWVVCLHETWKKSDFWSFGLGLGLGLSSALLKAGVPFWRIGKRLPLRNAHVCFLVTVMVQKHARVVPFAVEHLLASGDPCEGTRTFAHCFEINLNIKHCSISVKRIWILKFASVSFWLDYWSSFIMRKIYCSQGMIFFYSIGWCDWKGV